MTDEWVIGLFWDIGDVASCPAGRTLYPRCPVSPTSRLPDALRPRRPTPPRRPASPTPHDIPRLTPLTEYASMPNRDVRLFRRKRNAIHVWPNELERTLPLMAAVLFVIGALLAVYGVTIMVTWSGTWFFAVWYVLAAIAFALGALVHTGTWETIPTIIKRIGAGCAVIALAMLVITQVFILGGFNETPDDDADYLVVLGAQVYPTGPSVVLRYRLDAACDYLVDHPETRCIVTGCQGGNEPMPEGRAMAQYLAARGIDPKRILEENEARKTVENIAYSKALLDSPEARVVIVTNNFHLFRSMSIARKQGLQNISGLPAGSRAWYLPNNLLRESLGVVKDFATGNM